MPTTTQRAAFAGRLVAVPETRQLDVLANLFESRGAEVLRCPLVAIEDAPEAAPITAWIERIIAAPPALFVLYTGEGLERLLGFAERAGLRERFVAALAQTRTLCRGPKPKRALKRIGLKAGVDAHAPTTAGVIETLETLNLAQQRVAVQLYGDQRIPELEACLEQLDARADFVAPYIYASKTDEQRVVDLITRLEKIDAITFTSKSQVERLFKVADKHDLRPQLTRGLTQTCVAAVGPVVAATLESNGVSVDVMPDESFFMKPLVTALATRLGA